MIPPLVLQMLVENAIKHNVISEENPLSINIFIEGDFIVVENNVATEIRTCRRFHRALASTIFASDMSF